MEYAVVKTGGKQYKVAPGDTLEIDKVAGATDSEIEFKEVLLLVSDGKVQIGTPVLANIVIKGKILEQKKGDKIHVRKFKAKARYRKHIGFRAHLTKIQIVEADQFGSKKTSQTKSSSKLAPKKRAGG